MGAYMFHFGCVSSGCRPVTGDEKKVVRNYVAKARLRIIHETAAKAWSMGVPWGEALAVATKAVETADASAKPFARRGKGKGRGKGCRK